jgi:hypothetical protein
LRTSRVVNDPVTPLERALETNLDGYVVFEPADALLLSDGARGVVTFEDGVPVVAYESGQDKRGEAAVRALSTPGPIRTEVYEVPTSSLSDAHDEVADAYRVPPGLPADLLADDPRLADRTREAAPAERLQEETDSVAAFLEDEARIAEIRERARAEAERRADEWGLSDQLADASAGEDREDTVDAEDTADDRSEPVTQTGASSLNGVDRGDRTDPQATDGASADHDDGSRHHPNIGDRYSVDDPGRSPLSPADESGPPFAETDRADRTGGADGTDASALDPEESLPEGLSLAPFADAADPDLQDLGNSAGLDVDALETGTTRDTAEPATPDADTLADLADVNGLDADQGLNLEALSGTETGTGTPHGMTTDSRSRSAASAGTSGDRTDVPTTDSDSPREATQTEEAVESAFVWCTDPIARTD